MTTRNLVPRADSQGKIGISGTRWEEVNAVTIKATSLQNSNGSSLLVNDAGIKDIATVNNQLVIALDGTFLTDRLGFNADATKPDFTLPNGDALPNNTIIAAGDSLVAAVQKLNDSLRDVAAPTNLTVGSFTAATIVLESEGISNNDNDTTLPTSAAVKDYVDSQLTSQDLDFQGDAGGALSVDLDSEVLTISGGTGLSTSGAGQTLTVNLDDTAVTAGSYGDATNIATFTVDAQGRLTAAGTAAISTSFTLSADAGDDDTFNNGGTLTFTGGTGITTTVSDDTITIDLDDTAVTAGAYGSATAIPTFTVDAQGRLTAAGTAAISTTLNILSDDGGDANPVALAVDTLSLLGGTGITSTNTGDAVTFNLNNTAVTAAQYGDADSVAQFTVDAQGRLTAAANVDISIVSSQVSDATAANTADKIVLRDASGDFAAGTITATLSGNASTASKWAQAITLSLGTDLSGSVDIDGNGDVTLNATIAENSVALGTDTTGNYVQSLTAGAGITTFPAASESADLTISVDGVLAQLDSLTPLANGDDDGKFIVATADDTFSYESGSTVRTSLGLGTGDSPEFSGLTLDNQGSLVLQELNANAEGEPATVKSISIQAPAQLTGSYSLTLPTNDGDQNQILTTDGEGVLSWTTVNAIVDAVESFSTIAVAGEANIVAGASEATLTIAAGDAIALTTAADTDTLTIAVSDVSNAEIAADAAIADSKLATISTANKVALTALDINDGVDIGADLVDADLIIVDDGGAGTSNRKSAMSRVATFINNHTSITTLSSLSSVGSNGQTLTAAGNLTISGNLIVNGDSTTVTTSTLAVQDSLISLAKDNNASDTLDIGFYGLYDSTDDNSQDSYAGLFRDADDGGKFKLFKDLQVAPTATVNTAAAGYSKATLVADLEGNVTGTVSSLANHDTADLAEGTNLYFTDARARGAISVTDAGGDGSLTYVNGTGVLTYTGPSAAETRAHFSAGTGVTITDGEVAIGQAVATDSDVTFNTVSADLTGAVTGTVSSLANHDTDDVAEGSSNLYYTDARARGAVSITDAGGDGSLAYNNGTGVITYTGPSAEETRAHFSGGTGVTITDGEVAIGQAVATDSDVTFNTVSADLTGNVTGTVSSLANHDTDDVSEGSSNLYHTTARAREAVSVTDAGGDGSLAYNNGTGVITYTGPSAAETRAHFSGGTGVTITDGAVSIGQAVATDSDVTFNTVSADLTGAVTGTVSDVSNHDTDDIAEGSSNLYHTTARARESVSVTDAGGDGSLAYNSGTGVITYTGPSAAETRAHFSGGSGIDITDGSISLDISEIAEAEVAVASDSIVILDASYTDNEGVETTNLTRRETIADFITGITSTGLSASSGQVSLNYDDSTIGIIANGDDAGKVEVKDSGVTLAKLANLDNMKVIGNTSGDAATPSAIDILDEDTMSSDSATSLVTQQSVKAYVDGKLGRHGGIFLTDSADNNHANDDYNRDVIFDSSPLIRSHFGPFAFDLGQLHTEGGSDIIFYGSTSFQSSDRHFEVALNTTQDELTTNMYDTVFTGANENTP